MLILLFRIFIHDFLHLVKLGYRIERELELRSAALEVVLRSVLGYSEIYIAVQIVPEKTEHKLICEYHNGNRKHIALVFGYIRADTVKEAVRILLEKVESVINLL